MYNETENLILLGETVISYSSVYVCILFESGEKFNVDIFIAWDQFIAAKFSSEYDSVDITSEY